ncbi:MAG: phosphoglycerate kinase [Candidatus Caenarcaniphilales bacterium]|nr:phosphoglycerate kinase [Candidatus Caenarcaniphilales bacterium]
MINHVIGLEDLKPEQLEGKRVFVRVDFNVPVVDGAITDTARLRASLPTIRYLIEKRAIVVLASHFGRPKGGEDPKYSLALVAKKLEELLGQPVTFLPKTIGAKTEATLSALPQSSVSLLENVRFNPGEEKNDPAFSAALANLGELYVNDAFGSAHRAHASTVGITAFLKPAVAGLLMEKEVRELSSLLDRPERPFTSIIGGSKVSTKLDILHSLVKQSDLVLIGGGMAYTFIKAQGGKVGKSLCEPDLTGEALKVMELANQKGTALILPNDFRCVKDFADKNEKAIEFQAGEIPDEYEGCDIGPLTESAYSRYILESKTVLWNGPVGIFEDKRFEAGSKAIATALAKLQRGGGKTVIGGGDSASAVAQFGFTETDFSHISTGGGASLEFLAGQTLPGVAALDTH